MENETTATSHSPASKMAIATSPHGAKSIDTNQNEDDGSTTSGWSSDATSEATTPKPNDSHQEPFESTADNNDLKQSQQPSPPLPPPPPPSAAATTPKTTSVSPRKQQQPRKPNLTTISTSPRSLSASSSSPVASFAKVSPVAHLTGRQPFPVNRALPRPHIPSLLHATDDDDNDDDDEDTQEVVFGQNIGHSPKQRRQQEESLYSADPSNNNISSSNNTGLSSAAAQAAALNASSFMSVEDLEICQRLDWEYERALEEREIAYNARFHSVRQSAVVCVVFMFFLLSLATVFYMHQTHWDMSECLLFSVYTITTVGYGSHTIPATAAFQLYTICFIFIGVATLTIMVAQIYQCLALEASRAQHSRDKSEMARRGLDTVLSHSNMSSLQRGGPNNHLVPQQKQQGRRAAQQRRQQKPEQVATSEQLENDGDGAVIVMNDDGGDDTSTTNASVMAEILSTPLDFWYQCYNRMKHFFQNTEYGRGISVIIPFAGLILIGAIVVGPLEGWTPLEALYFAVVSLTTVGFGDYYPTKSSTIWFCIFWLPFSVGFMSLFLGNIANFYLRLSDQNIQRIERQLRRRLRLAKEKAEQDRIDALRRARRGQDAAAAGVVDSSPSAIAANLSMVGSSDAEEVERVAVLAAAAARRRNGGAPSGFDVLPMQEEEGEDQITESEQAARRHQAALFGSPNWDSGGGLRRRERILYNSIYAPASSATSANTLQQPRQHEPDQSGINKDENDDNAKQHHKQQAQQHHHHQQSGNSDSAQRPRGQTMATMRDVVRRVRLNLAHSDGEAASTASSSIVGIAGPTDRETEFMSRRSTARMNTASLIGTGDGGNALKPSFALRVLVQERMAEIIAVDIAGFQSSIEIKDNTLSVTIETLRQTADKWLIPRRARKAFRAVAFETLYFVGEHGLITRGAEALYDLTPFEFHGLFNPLLAAMGDAEMMEAWLANTEVLAEVDLKRDALLSSSSSLSTSLTTTTTRFAMASTETTTSTTVKVAQMPKKNSVRNNHRRGDTNKPLPLPEVS